MRNPWGKDQSFKGGWDANSSYWNRIGEKVQNEINSRNQTDGQFIVDYAFFASNFDQIDFVHVDMNAFYDDDSNNSLVKWTTKQIFGAWVGGQNAGGCGNDDSRNYWLNPQYSLVLPSNWTNGDGKVSIIVALLQCDQVKNRYQNNGSFSSSNLAQAFNIYRVRDDQKSSSEAKYRDRDLEEVGTTEIYVGKREITKRFEFEPGNYVIIPSLFNKDDESNFLIRLFFESDAVNVNEVQVRKMKHQDEDTQGQQQSQDERPQTRNVKQPVFDSSGEEGGKFTHFLSNNKTVSQMKHEFGSYLLGKVEQGVRSRACLIM
jgi:calpain